jgi:hypothetical protein
MPGINFIKPFRLKKLNSFSQADTPSANETFLSNTPQAALLASGLAKANTTNIYRFWSVMDVILGIAYKILTNAAAKVLPICLGLSTNKENKFIICVGRSFIFIWLLVLSFYENKPNFDSLNNKGEK